MIDYQILFPFLIFLPALLGFVGCVIPKITFPLSVVMLLGYAASSFNYIGRDIAYQFTLVGEGGIQFSVDSYSFPLIFGSCITLLIQEWEPTANE